MATRSSIILTRAIVVDMTRGRVRIKEFHLVVTSLGNMLEPRSLRPQFRDEAGTFAPDDELALIDTVELIDGRERFRIQNPTDYGNPLKWSCIHDLQLGPTLGDSYTQYGKGFTGPAGA